MPLLCAELKKMDTLCFHASVDSGEGTLSGNSFLLRYDTASSEGDSSPSQPPKCTAFIQGFNAGKPLSKLVSNSAKSFIPTRNTTKQIESKEVGVVCLSHMISCVSM